MGPSPLVLQKIKETFKRYDTNNDGGISRSELCFLLRQMNPEFTEEELLVMFDMADLDCDGVLNFNEFVDFIWSRPNLDPQAENLELLNKLKRGKRAPGEFHSETSDDGSRQAAQVFRLLTHPGKDAMLHPNALKSAVRLLGYNKPVQDLLESALVDINQRLGCDFAFTDVIEEFAPLLDKAQFKHFVVAFEKLVKKQIKAESDALGDDCLDNYPILQCQLDEEFQGTSNIVAPKLQVILDSVGITVRIDVVVEALQCAYPYAVKKIEDVSDKLSILKKTVTTAAHYVQKRYGFTTCEIGRFHEVWNRIPDSKDALPVAQCFTRIARWMDFTCSEDAIRTKLVQLGVTKTADQLSPSPSPKNGDDPACAKVDFELALALLSICFECEEEAVLEYVTSGGAENIRPEELLQLLQHFGYSMLPGMEIEYLESLGLQSGQQQFTLEDFWRILCHARTIDGFSSEELKEFTAAYHTFAPANGQPMTPPQVRRALRKLGFAPLPITSEMQRQQTSDLDLSNSETLDFISFLRLLRECREIQFCGYERMFRAFGKDNKPLYPPAGKLLSGYSTTQTILAALGYASGERNMGQAMHRVHQKAKEKTKSAVTPLYSELAQSVSEDFNAAFGFWNFVCLADAYRDVLRDDMQQTGLFSDAEVAEIKKEFEQHDTNGNGELSRLECRHMLEKMMPQMAADQEKRAKMQEMLEKVDYTFASDGDMEATLDFSEFLWFVQFSQDEVFVGLKEHRDKVVEETGYGVKEVSEFHKIFDMTASLTMTMKGEEKEAEISEIVNLLRQSIYLSDGDAKSVVTRIMDADEDGNNHIDFCEFLRFMKKLQDDNFAKIQEKADKMQRALEREEQAIAETQFTLKQVEEMRAIFEAHAGGTEGLVWSQVEKMIGGAVKLDDASVKELEMILKSTDDDGNNLIDFPELLRLMHTLMSHNFADLRDKLKSEKDEVLKNLQDTHAIQKREEKTPYVGKRGRKCARVKQG